LKRWKSAALGFKIVLEGWILLGLHLQHPIPVLDEIDLNLHLEAVLVMR
jgi:hypothetical protein